MSSRRIRATLILTAEEDGIGGDKIELMKSSFNLFGTNFAQDDTYPPYKGFPVWNQESRDRFIERVALEGVECSRSFLGLLGAADKIREGIRVKDKVK